MFTYQDIINNPSLLDNYKSHDLFPLKCCNCGIQYNREQRFIKSKVLTRYNKMNFCSKLCHAEYKRIFKERECKNCGKTFLPKKMSKNGRNKGLFCSQYCAASYNNKNKSHGTRRSKLEKYLEEQLTILYPDIEIHFNRKDAIGSELDIYIPNFKLAFELNGVFHYEPIYGEKKLEKIQENDINKFQECQKNGISLCIIDTSGQKYFKESTSNKYLKIIQKIMVSLPGVQPGSRSVEF